MAAALQASLEDAQQAQEDDIARAIQESLQDAWQPQPAAGGGGGAADAAQSRGGERRGMCTVAQARA